MMTKTTIGAALLGLCLAALPLAANAAYEKGRYTDPACDVEKPACGAIVYANAGGYNVKSVHLEARDPQPNGVTTNPQCTGMDYKFDNGIGLALGQYNTFVVPAQCAYKLKINIEAGPKKDQNLYLTVGCLLETKTDGTTISNEWHVTSKWTKAAEKAGASGAQMDPAGNKCGRQSKM